MVITFTFPSGAPGNLTLLGACSGTAGSTSASAENLEGCSSTLTYNFTATQRAGTNK
jgi:hypothetical protein